MFEGFPIVETLSILSMFIINYLKYRSDIIKADKRNEQQHKMLFDKINEITLSINDEHKLFDDITIAGITIIQSNMSLDSKIIRLINATVKEVREFAIKYNKSHYRKNKTDLSEYLKIESATIFTNLDVLADDIFPKKNINTIGYSYSQFMREFSDIELIVRDVIRRLIKNGMTRAEYNKLFVSFIKELILEQIKLWNEWRRNY